MSLAILLTLGVPQGVALRARMIVMTRRLWQPELIPAGTRGIAHAAMSLLPRMCAETPSLYLCSCLCRLSHSFFMSHFHSIFSHVACSLNPPPLNLSSHMSVCWHGYRLYVLKLVVTMDLWRRLSSLGNRLVLLSLSFHWHWSRHC